MVNKELLKEIEEFCKLNELEVEKTLNEALRSGFTILKFGPTPTTTTGGEKLVEVIKEVIKEVPVEKIVEKIIEVPVERIVEVVREVPVEKIIDKEVIKEVPVEKTITINVGDQKLTYMEYIDQLTNNVSKLEVELKKQNKTNADDKNKITSLEKDLEKYKTRLKNCMEEKNTGYDIYGER